MDNEQLSLQLKGLQQMPDMLTATVYERIDTHLLERMQWDKPPACMRIKAALSASHEGYVRWRTGSQPDSGAHLPTFMAKSLVILIRKP